MKAVVCTRYGPPEVLQLEELPKPRPNAREVCIRNLATAVTGSDVIIRRANLPFFMGLMFRLMIGLRKPRKRVIGLIFAGEIESVGKDVTRFSPGDQVYGFTGLRLGAYAEYLCVPETESKQGCVVIKPAAMSFEEAAAVAYGGVLAPYFLNKRDENLKGRKVLVYGASGAFGTTFVQLLKHMGAEVTGVCSTSSIALVESLGADHVIDYTGEDIADRSERYDCIVDAVPYGKTDIKKLRARCRRVLSANGRFVSINEGSPPVNAEHLLHLNALFEAGQFRAVIDRSYPLEQIVEAHRYVDTGRKKGNVVITVNHQLKA